MIRRASAPFSRQAKSEILRSAVRRPPAVRRRRDKLEYIRGLGKEMNFMKPRLNFMKQVVNFIKVGFNFMKHGFNLPNRPRTAAARPCQTVPSSEKSSSKRPENSEYSGF